MNLSNIVIDMLFPHGKCSICDGITSGKSICRKCYEEITIPTYSFCSICGRYFSSDTTTKHHVNGHKPVCWDCMHNPPAFYMARSLGPYQGPLKEAIYQLKYQRKRSLANILSILLSKRILLEEGFNGINSIVPVPMSAEKEKMRGFNQSELLAFYISKQTGIPMNTPLIRKYNTPRLSNLSYEERYQAIKGVFRISESVKNSRILLIDDVFTTGVTSCECAIMLLQEGAQKVGVMTLASGFK